MSATSSSARQLLRLVEGGLSSQTHWTGNAVSSLLSHEIVLSYVKLRPKDAQIELEFSEIPKAFNGCRIEFENFYQNV